VGAGVLLPVGCAPGVVGIAGVPTAGVATGVLLPCCAGVPLLSGAATGVPLICPPVLPPPELCWSTAGEAVGDVVTGAGAPPELLVEGLAGLLEGETEGGVEGFVAVTAGGGVVGARPAFCSSVCRHRSGMLVTLQSPTCKRAAWLRPEVSSSWSPSWALQ
jgi:hypothetical protein